MLKSKLPDEGQFRPSNDFPPDASIPPSDVPLESILLTEELHHRPSRSPQYEIENRALVALAGALADSPRTILQTLAETILKVTECDSSGVSLLTPDGKRFYWPAIAGRWTPHIGGGTPRDFGPCGDVLDRNRPLLMQHFEWRYTYLLPVAPPAEEGLLVPFYVEGKAVGTIWAVMHDDRRKFDAEDERLLTSLGQFASTAYQALASIDELKFQIGEREKAETAVRELANGLETQVRVRTQELECSTRELLATNKELEREIAERKRAEETRRESQELLELVLATLPVGVAVTDRQDDIVLVNETWQRIWGGEPIVSGSKRKAQSKGYWHDSGKRVDPAEWASMRALSEGQTSLNELIDIETFDGKSKTMRNSAAPIRNAEGLIVGAVIVNEDVTERVRAEDEVRKNEEQLRDVIDTIPVIAFISMPDGSNEFTNRSWQEYTGLSVKDTAGWGWASTVHPDEIARHLEKWRAAVSAGTTFDNAARYRGANGQYRWFLVRAVPLRDERGNLLRWYGVLMDIEDRVHAEQALRESAERLQHLSRRLLAIQEEERRHLSRELHDEFGQLLATITVQLHAARSVAGEAVQSILEECMAVLQRAGEQVRSLALELRPAMLDTAGLDATLRWLAAQHEQRTGIPAEVVGHLNEVSGDVAIACFRMVQEALTNVVRHARAQRIWIELGQIDGVLELVVRDDGVGFDVTGTLDRAARRGHLGLLGIKERVQILGGDLEVESKPGQGTRVRISLPLSEPVPETAEPPA
jgi:PAS domain S-box-containing protein